MWTILAGIFLVLHGLVHLLYAGQSGRYFELRPGMTWPDGSWLFSKLIGDETTRTLMAALLVLAALGLVIGGASLLFRQEWWRSVTAGAAAFSTALYLLFWDGRFRALDDQGGIGVLINLAILFIVLILRWGP